MKSVFRAANALEANIVKGLLESNGIEAFIAGEHVSTAYGGSVLGMDSRVMVDERDEVSAKRIISEYENQSDE